MISDSGAIEQGISRVVCKDSLAGFCSRYLGYKTALVPFKPSDLGIPNHISKNISEWHIVSNYPAAVAFQVHFVKVKDLYFDSCKTINTSFWEKHPGGRYLFIFTNDFSYILFFTVELSLERKPRPGQAVWPKVAKYYYPYLLVKRSEPTYNDNLVLKALRFDHNDTDGLVMYEKVLEALKRSNPSEPPPKWFFPYTYKRFGLL